MKTLIVMLGLSLVGFKAYAQSAEAILDQYIKVKDALVASDNKMANLHTLSLQKYIEETPTFNEKESLLKAVAKLGNTDDLEKQRIAFGDVSVLLWRVVKGSGNLSKEVYYQYCPMKKMYWLSREETIKNPYYGSKMLTCGNVADKKVN
jgi:hypothetical protein